ncbi:MAG: hypothetical protein Q9211_003037 [Gyalolechia sp. 1 TL-2023]
MATSVGKCEDDYLAVNGTPQQTQQSLQRSIISKDHQYDAHHDIDQAANDAEREHEAARNSDPDDHSCRRIIHQFVIRWFMIIMSTGVISTMLHQFPYHARWLNLLSYIFFAVNLALFLLFTFISILRYTLYPQIFPAVMRHPQQSLFVATFPMGLANLINMIVLACAPAWGHGWATFAWVLWLVDTVIALATCFHLLFVM